MGRKQKIEFFGSCLICPNSAIGEKCLQIKCVLLKTRASDSIICLCPKVPKWGHFGPTSVTPELALNHMVQGLLRSMQGVACF